MPEGAVDNDYDDAEQTYEEFVADQLEDVRRTILEGDIVLDLVTRQPMVVRSQKAETLAAHWESEDFDLLSYKMHPYLPVRAEDAVFECVFISANAERAHSPGKTYDYPRGRLMRLPIEQAGGAD
jgi:hypothetical protein